MRNKIYLKAKAEPEWRFWGLYTHICKVETLEKAYYLARKNNGSPGVDGVSFRDIEEIGVRNYILELLQELLKESTNHWSTEVYPYLRLTVREY